MKRQEYKALVEGWRKILESDISNNYQDNVFEKDIFDNQKLFESCLALEKELDLISAQMLIENNDYLLSNVYRLDEAGIFSRFKDALKFKKDTGEKIDPNDPESLNRTENSRLTKGIYIALIVAVMASKLAGSVGFSVSHEEINKANQEISIQATNPELGAVTYKMVTPDDIKKAQQLSTKAIKDVVDNSPDEVKKEATKTILKVLKNKKKTFRNLKNKVKTKAQKRAIDKKMGQVDKAIAETKGKSLEDVMKIVTKNHPPKVKDEFDKQADELETEMKAKLTAYGVKSEDGNFWFAQSESVDTKDLTLANKFVENWLKSNSDTLNKPLFKDLTDGNTPSATIMKKDPGEAPREEPNPIYEKTLKNFNDMSHDQRQVLYNGAKVAALLQLQKDNPDIFKDGITFKSIVFKHSFETKSQGYQTSGAQVANQPVEGTSMADYNSAKVLEGIYAGLMDLKGISDEPVQDFKGFEARLESTFNKFNQLSKHNLKSENTKSVMTSFVIKACASADSPEDVIKNLKSLGLKFEEISDATEVLTGHGIEAMTFDSRGEAEKIDDRNMPTVDLTGADGEEQMVDIGMIDN